MGSTASGFTPPLLGASNVLQASAPVWHPCRVAADFGTFPGGVAKHNHRLMAAIPFGILEMVSTEGSHFKMVVEIGLRPLWRKQIKISRRCDGSQTYQQLLRGSCTSRQPEVRPDFRQRFEHEQAFGDARMGKHERFCVDDLIAEVEQIQVDDTRCISLGSLSTAEFEFDGLGDFKQFEGISIPSDFHDGVMESR